MARVSVFSRDKMISSNDASQSLEQGGGSFSTPVSSPHSVQVSQSSSHVNLDYIDVPPIQISTMKDTHGRLSDMVEQKMNSLGVVCLPIQMTSILPQVEELQRYDLYRCGDQTFITARVIREQLMQEVEQKIIETLESGLSYSEDVLKANVYNGQSYNNLVYTLQEQSYLISRFRLYHAEIRYTKEPESLILKVEG